MSPKVDMLPTIQPKSDQLNADNLLAGPITVTITSASDNGGKDQPIVLGLSGGHMPWKPNKGTRRVLVQAWGPDAAEYVGRRVTLYRDPKAEWGGVAVGGIRIKALSHIHEPRTYQIAVSRNRKEPYPVLVLRDDEPASTGKPTANLDALIRDEGLTVEAVDEWRASKRKGPIAECDDKTRADFAAWLVSNPVAIDEIRALVPTDSTPEPGADLGTDGELP